MGSISGGFALAAFIGGLARLKTAAIVGAVPALLYALLVVVGLWDMLADANLPYVLGRSPHPVWRSFCSRSLPITCDAALARCSVASLDECVLLARPGACATYFPVDHLSQGQPWSSSRFPRIPR
jgi:hypothetical protein